MVHRDVFRKKQDVCDLRTAVNTGNAETAERGSTKKKRKGYFFTLESPRHSGFCRLESACASQPTEVQRGVKRLNLNASDDVPLHTTAYVTKLVDAHRSDIFLQCLFFIIPSACFSVFFFFLPGLKRQTASTSA